MKFTRSQNYIALEDIMRDMEQNIVAVLRDSPNLFPNYRKHKVNNDPHLMDAASQYAEDSVCEMFPGVFPFKFQEAFELKPKQVGEAKWAKEKIVTTPYSVDQISGNNKEGLRDLIVNSPQREEIQKNSFEFSFSEGLKVGASFKVSANFAGFGGAEVGASVEVDLSASQTWHHEVTKSITLPSQSLTVPPGKNLRLDIIVQKTSGEVTCDVIVEISGGLRGGFVLLTDPNNENLSTSWEYHDWLVKYMYLNKDKPEFAAFSLDFTDYVDYWDVSDWRNFNYDPQKIKPGNPLQGFPPAKSYPTKVRINLKGELLFKGIEGTDLSTNVTDITDDSNVKRSGMSSFLI